MIAPAFETLRSDGSVEQVVKCDLFKDYNDARAWFYSARPSFMTLWQSINGPESWDANPWVWVIEFKHLDTP